MMIGELLDRFESLVRRHRQLANENHSIDEAFMLNREYLTARKQLEWALSEGHASYDDRKTKGPSDVDYSATALDYAAAFACGLFGPYALSYHYHQASKNVKPTDGPVTNPAGGEARNK